MRPKKAVMANRKAQNTIMRFRFVRTTFSSSPSGIPRPWCTGVMTSREVRNTA